MLPTRLRVEVPYHAWQEDLLYMYGLSIGLRMPKLVQPKAAVVPDVSTDAFDMELRPS